MKKSKVDEIVYIPEESQNLTIEKIKAALPKNTSVSVTKEIINVLNNMEDDTGLPQNILEEDFMTYSYLIGNKKGVGIMHLINAIKYCNLKRNRSNIKAWAIVFPAKYDKLIAAGKQIDNHVSMYTGTWLVQEIDKEMLIPVHLQYASAFHKLAQQNIRIAMGDGGFDRNGDPVKVSAMVMQQACKTGMEMFRQPETAKIDITMSANSAMLDSQNEMNDHLAKLVQAHSDSFRRGEEVSKLQIVHRDIDAEIK